MSASRFNGMRFPLILIVGLAAAAAGIAVFCYTQLEIVDAVRWRGASQIVRINPYLALERWLGAAGYPVRSHSAGTVETILRGPERIIFLEDSRFNWTVQNGTAAAQLIPWIKEGGRLIVSLDAYANQRLTTFMEALGIEELDPGDAETLMEKIKEKAETETTEDESARIQVSFDWQKSFTILEKKSTVDRIRVMIDDSIKLVWLDIGKGWIVFTGQAVFLHNYRLDDEGNARLAGELFLDKPDAESAGSGPGAGILLIRSLSGDRRILGNLAERGNPAALLAALALVIIAGLWMALPGFGRFRPAPEKPGKSLRERFLAEGRFLKKYRALGKYIETYRRELEQRRAPRAENRNAAENGGRAASITLREFVKTQRILLEQLDHLDQHTHPDQHSIREEKP